MDPGELTVSLNGPEHLRCSRQTFCSLSSLAFPPCPGGPTCPWCGHRDSLSCLHHHHGCLATCLQHKHTHMCYQHQVQPATQKHSMSVASLACNTKTQHVSSQSCLQHRNTACQQQLLPATQKHSMSAAGLACNTEAQPVSSKFGGLEWESKWENGGGGGGETERKERRSRGGIERKWMEKWV